MLSSFILNNTVKVEGVCYYITFTNKIKLAPYPNPKKEELDD